MRHTSKIHDWRARGEELIWDRQSIFYWPDEAPDDPLLSPQLDLADVHSLVSDVALSLVPRARLRDTSWSVILSPPNVKAEALLTAALDRDGNAHTLEYALKDFVQECATVLLLDGNAHYEIVTIRERASGRAVGFQLSLLQTATLSRRRGQWMQYVPASVAQKRGCDRYVPLCSQRILSFGAERKTQERKKFGAMLECLAWQNRHLLAQFWGNYDPATPAKNRVPFDSTHHILTQALAEAHATQDIGYNARGLLEKYTSDFYTCHRELKFQGFIIQTRDTIMNTLNQGLERIESMLGVDIGALSNIRLNGVPTLADVEAAQTKLREGTVSPSKLLYPFRGY